MNKHPYRGISAAFATKHHKEMIVSPIFARLGINIVVANFDTDLLGTFSGETPRVGTPKEVVLHKARMGISHSGLSFALASEGSIGLDPLIPFVISDTECMAWIDSSRNIEIVEFYKSLEIVAAHIKIARGDSLDNFLKNAQFPEHSLIAKSENSAGQIFKGINSFKSLDAAIKTLFKESERVVIESDLRAHHSPSRRKNIATLAERLVARLNTLCPSCTAPGWGEVGYLFGLPCRQCRSVENNSVRGRRLGCSTCNYKEEILNGKKSIEPAECGSCNP